MAARLRARRNAFDIWPGFVDALTSLLIIMMFVVVVFLAAQYFMSDVLSGQQRDLQSKTSQIERQTKTIDEQKITITELYRRINELAAILSVEREKGKKAEESAAALEAELRATLQLRDQLQRERDALQSQVGELGRARLTLEERMAALEARARALDAAKAEAERKAAGADASRAEAEKKAAGSEAAKGDAEKRAQLAEAERAAIEARLAELDRRMKELEAQKAVAEKRAVSGDADRAALEERLRRLEAVIADLQAERDRLAAAGAERGKSLDEEKRLTDEQARQLALLNRQIAALRQQMAAIQSALEAAEARNREQRTQIEDLGSRLNQALAQRVRELERYRSEFFGRMREILANRRDIRIVGDRFVFQSEVLFGSGSDELQEGGRQRLADLAGALKDIVAKAPKDLNWVLRVDGHTDKRPIRGKFPSNWELSSARAIAVVKFLAEEGIPANRLVAAGFGEHQPLEAGDSDEALARNRRIELKITER